MRWSVSVLLLWLVSTLPAAGAEPVAPIADLVTRDYLAEHPQATLVVGYVDADGPQVWRHDGAEATPGELPPAGKIIYPIGSITKVFTGTLLAERVVAGELALDTPAAELLPEGFPLPREENRQITLGDLATHHSGLPRLPPGFFVFVAASNTSDDPYSKIEMANLASMLRGAKLNHPIGTHYEYSNLGSGLLGRALVRHAGAESFHALVRERIAEPLGMPDTGIELSEEQLKRVPHAYQSDGTSAVAWNFAAMEACGALRSTADDLLRFAAANLGLVACDLQPALELAQRPCTGKRYPHGRMGLGWHLADANEHRPQTRWHNGGTAGYHSMLILVPSERFAVCVLSNVGASVDDVAWQMVDRLVADSGESDTGTSD